MILKTSFKLRLKSRTATSTGILQDHNKWNTAPYARGVALCLPLTRPASAPLARPALLKLARLAGKEESNLLCASRGTGRSRLHRTARYTASNPRDVAGSGTTRRRTACRTRGNNLLCASRGTGRSRLRRTARCSASYARVALGGRNSGGQLPRSLPATAPAFFFSFARKEFINNSSGPVFRCSGISF
jgi:hypothetical protein